MEPLGLCAGFLGAAGVGLFTGALGPVEFSFFVLDLQVNQIFFEEHLVWLVAFEVASTR